MIRVKSLGRAISERVGPAYTVWEKLPKKILKKHPNTYVICPDFKIRIPRGKFLSQEQQEKTYKFTVQMFSSSRAESKVMLDYMLTCGKKEITVGKFAFWLHAVKYSAESRRPGGFWADLTYTFKLRQLKLREIKQMEENYG